MNDETVLIERLREQQSAAGNVRVAPDLRGRNLAHADLRRLDLRDADLSGARIDETTWLQGATIAGTAFHGISIAHLLASGITPRDLLHARALADGRGIPRLAFAPSTGQRAAAPTSADGAKARTVQAIALTERECARVCAALAETTWEAITTEAVFGALYEGEIWQDWLGRCASRAVLDWALLRRGDLNKYQANVPYYGRVMPAAIVDEVRDEDLVAGAKTNVRRVIEALGRRRLLAESDLQGENVSYPRSPFGDDPARHIAQVTSRQDLQLEGAAMHHCVASYDPVCLQGTTFIYHVGPPAPAGSTLELFPDGRVGQHRAVSNRRPAPEEAQAVAEWLQSHGIERVTTSLMERLCARLQAARVRRVTFQIYWLNDEDTVDSVIAADERGADVFPLPVTEDELWDLTREEQGGVYARWELDVAARRLRYLGEADVPEDDDYYDDEAPADDDMWDD